MSLWRMRNKGGKSDVMILALQGRILQTLQGSCVHVIARARNPLAAVQERSQGKLPTSCKVDLWLPPSRANPTRRGIALDVCPRTPPRLQVEFSHEQRNYPSIPRLHRLRIVHGFEVEMAINYYKQDVALREARKEEVYKYDKSEGLERRFGASSMKTSIPQ